MDTPQTFLDRSQPVLVTGATGMVGGAIVGQLLSAGWSVRVLVRPNSQYAWLRDMGAEPTFGDLHDLDALARAGAGCCAVIHSAAKVDLMGPPRAFRHINAQGTRNLLAATATTKLKQFIHISSVAVHAAVDRNGAVVTETTPFAPLPRFAGYAASKRLAEQAVRTTARKRNFEYTILRLGFIYGPGNRMMHDFLRPLLAKRTFALPNGGRRRFAPLFVDDAASAAVAALGHPQAKNEPFVVVGPDEIAQRDFFHAHAEGFGLAPPRRSVPAALAFLAAWGVEGLGLLQGRTLRINRALIAACMPPEHFSTDKIRRRLGWQPRVRPTEGLQRTFAWYQCRYPNVMPAVRTDLQTT